MPTPGSNALIATSVGISLSGTFIGTALTLSYIAVPSLLLPASSASKQSASTTYAHASQQWQFIYNLGSQLGPVASAIGSASYVYAATILPVAAVTQKQLLYAAAVANILVAPFTGAFMKRTNDELHRRADAATAGKDEAEGRTGAAAGSIESYETPDLLQRWTRLNMVRSVFPIAAIGLATGALTL